MASKCFKHLQTHAIYMILHVTFTIYTSFYMLFERWTQGLKPQNRAEDPLDHALTEALRRLDTLTTSRLSPTESYRKSFTKRKKVCLQICLLSPTAECFGSSAVRGGGGAGAGSGPVPERSGRVPEVPEVRKVLVEVRAGFGRFWWRLRGRFREVPEGSGELPLSIGYRS